jgi:hypothetical protein
MLRRRKDELPTTLPANHAASNGLPDGSGKSIKMDAPLVKAIRSSSDATKYTYVWLGVSLLFVWVGWSWIRSGSGKICCV